jgi:hypothetical protein
MSASCREDWKSGSMDYLAMQRAAASLPTMLSERRAHRAFKVLENFLSTCQGCQGRRRTMSAHLFHLEIGVLSSKAVSAEDAGHHCTRVSN